MNPNWLYIFVILSTVQIAKPLSPIFQVCLSSPLPFSPHAALCFLHTNDSQTWELNLIHNLEGLWKHRFLVPTGVPDPVGLSWNLSIGISNKFQGEVDAACLDHTLSTTVLYSFILSKLSYFLWDQHCYVATNSPFTLDLGTHSSFPPYPCIGWNLHDTFSSTEGSFSYTRKEPHPRKQFFLSIYVKVPPL